MPTLVPPPPLLLPVTAGEFSKAEAQGLGLSILPCFLVRISRLPGEFPSFLDLHLIYICLFVCLDLEPKPLDGSQPTQMWHGPPLGTCGMTQRTFLG